MRIVPVFFLFWFCLGDAEKVLATKPCPMELRFRGLLTNSVDYFARARGGNKTVALYGISIQELVHLRYEGVLPARRREGMRVLNLSAPLRLDDRDWYGPLRKYGSGQEVLLKGAGKKKAAADSTLLLSGTVSDPIQQRDPFYALSDSADLQGLDVPESLLRNLTKESPVSLAIVSLKESAFTQPLFIKSLDVWQPASAFLGFNLVVSRDRAWQLKDIGRIFATDQALRETEK